MSRRKRKFSRRGRNFFMPERLSNWKNYFFNSSISDNSLDYLNNRSLNSHCSSALNFRLNSCYGNSSIIRNSRYTTFNYCSQGISSSYNNIIPFTAKFNNSLKVSSILISSDRSLLEFSDSFNSVGVFNNKLRISNSSNNVCKNSFSSYEKNTEMVEDLLPRYGPFLSKVDFLLKSSFGFKRVVKFNLRTYRKRFLKDKRWVSKTFWNYLTYRFSDVLTEELEANFKKINNLENLESSSNAFSNFYKLLKIKASKFELSSSFKLLLLKSIDLFLKNKLSVNDLFIIETFFRKFNYRSFNKLLGIFFIKSIKYPLCRNVKLYTKTLQLFSKFIKRSRLLKTSLFNSIYDKNFLNSRAKGLVGFNRHRSSINFFHNPLAKTLERYFSSEFSDQLSAVNYSKNHTLKNFVDYNSKTSRENCHLYLFLFLWTHHHRFRYKAAGRKLFYNYNFNFFLHFNKNLNRRLI